MIYRYLNANNDKSFVIGGDFNKAINTNIDKKNVRQDTNKLCRQKVNTMIDLRDLVDIWRLQHPDKLQFNWHSNIKPPIFSRFDYFLISDNISNYILTIHIKPAINLIIHWLN